MTVRDQPAQAHGQARHGASAPAPRALRAPPGGRHSGPCDEVLAARLADGMRRVLWLGASLEHLIRRLAGAPAAHRSGRAPGAGGSPRPQLGRSRLGASAVKTQEL